MRPLIDRSPPHPFDTAGSPSSGPVRGATADAWDAALARVSQVARAESEATETCEADLSTVVAGLRHPGRAEAARRGYQLGALMGTLVVLDTIVFRRAEALPRSAVHRAMTQVTDDLRGRRGRALWNNGAATGLAAGWAAVLEQNAPEAGAFDTMVASQRHSATRLLNNWAARWSEIGTELDRADHVARPGRRTAARTERAALARMLGRVDAVLTLRYTALVGGDNGAQRWMALHSAPARGMLTRGTLFSEEVRAGLDRMILRATAPDTDTPQAPARTRRL